MIRGLIHRCVLSAPTSTAPDDYGQPSPTGFTPTATGVACRMQGAGSAEPELFLRATTAVGVDDRISDVETPAGTSLDAGPFAVMAVTPAVGRAELALYRVQLRRLTSIDQT